MDLSTVQQNLAAGKYESRESFKADVGLIVSNAKQYNAPGSFVHGEAINFETYFEKRMTLFYSLFYCSPSAVWSKICKTLAVHNEAAATSSRAPPPPKIKLSLSKPKIGNPSEGKAQPRVIKPAARESASPEDPPPPPYIDDGSHDLLQEVLAVERQQKQRVAPESKRTVLDSSSKGSSSKRKAVEVEPEDDEDAELLSLTTSKRHRPASPEPSPRFQPARVIVPGPSQRHTSIPSTKGKERAHTPSTSGRSTTPINEKKCKDLLRTLQNDPSSAIFRVPVHAINDGCPT